MIHIKNNLQLVYETTSPELTGIFEIDIQCEPEIHTYLHNYFNFAMLLVMEKRLLHVCISGSPYINARNHCCVQCRQ